MSVTTEQVEGRVVETLASFGPDEKLHVVFDV